VIVEAANAHNHAPKPPTRQPLRITRKVVKSEFSRLRAERANMVGRAKRGHLLVMPLLVTFREF
jgi:hypothetical protein